MTDVKGFEDDDRAFYADYISLSNVRLNRKVGYLVIGLD